MFVVPTGDKIEHMKIDCTDNCPKMTIHGRNSKSVHIRASGTGVIAGGRGMEVWCPEPSGMYWNEGDTSCEISAVGGASLCVFDM